MFNSTFYLLLIFKLHQRDEEWVKEKCISLERLFHLVLGISFVLTQISVIVYMWACLKGHGHNFGQNFFSFIIFTML